MDACLSSRRLCVSLCVASCVRAAADLSLCRRPGASPTTGSFCSTTPWCTRRYTHMQTHTCKHTCKHTHANTDSLPNKSYCVNMISHHFHTVEYNEPSVQLFKWFKLVNISETPPALCPASLCFSSSTYLLLNVYIVSLVHSECHSLSKLCKYFWHQFIPLHLPPTSSHPELCAAAAFWSRAGLCSLLTLLRGSRGISERIYEY